MSNSGNDNVDRAQNAYAAGKTDKDIPPAVPPKVIIITGGLTGGLTHAEIRSEEEFHPPGGTAAGDFESEDAGHFISICIDDPNYSGNEIGLKGPTKITLTFQPD